MPTRPFIRVQFDRFLAPDSAVRQAICLTDETIGAEIESARCIGGLLPAYDPADRVAVWILPGYLQPGTRYNVRIIAPENERDGNGIRAFDGAPLEKEFSFAFRTSSGPTAQLPDPRRDIALCDPGNLTCPLENGACGDPRPTALVAAAPAGIFSGCAGGSANCHAPGAPAGPGARGSALSLSADGIRRIVESAQLATETATDPNPTIAHRSPWDPFGPNMPYMDRNRPASSYLMYKVILADPLNCSGEADLDDDPVVCGATPTDAAAGTGAPSPIDPWIPAADWRPPAPGERSRLRVRIKGLGMPPSTRIAHRWVQTVSAFIAAGAKVGGCP